MNQQPEWTTSGRPVGLEARPGLGRRQFLGALAATGAAVGGLSACTSGATPGGGPGRGQVQSGVEMPAYVPLVPVEPDLPADEHGVPAGFFTFPHPAPAVTDSPPGDGSTVTAMEAVDRQMPVPMDRNAYWQGLNKRLGVTFEISMTPSKEYNAKLQTAVAGGQLPELVSLTRVMPRMPSMMEAKFADLTEYLSGDKVKDYPGLANLTPVMWRSATFNGGIGGVPTPNLVGSPTPLVRADIVEPLGVNPEPGNAEEFVEYCTALTDPSKNRFALAQPPAWVNAVLAPMHGAINGWTVDDQGGFTHGWETPAFREGLDLAKRLWDAKVFHPDSFAKINMNQAWKSGQVVLNLKGGVGYRTLLRADVPGLKLGILTPPKAEGGGPALKPLGPGVYKVCAINKDVPAERIPMLLSILSWEASPFGSAEYLYRVFGEEGVHHTWDDKLQAPIATDKLNAEQINHYFAAAPFALFDPGQQYATKAVHAYQQAVVPEGVHDASLGLYSETADRKGAEIDTPVADMESEVIQGRKTLDDWDAMVAEWRKAGGDKIRGEFESAYAESNG